jgi:purine nucleoside phosphorylase
MGHLRDAVRALRARTALVPTVALVLDPALAELRQVAVVEAAHPLDAGHALLVGTLAAVPLVLLVRGPELPVAARADAVRIARLLGADALVTAGSARPLTPGVAGLGVVEDHVGLLVPNPLVGPNLDELGPRFPDLTTAYDPALRALAHEEAVRAGGMPALAVYAALPDPNLATAEEYTVLREAGVDWVGKGGVAEVIAARHAGMRVLGLIGSEGSEAPLAALVRRVVGRLARPPRKSRSGTASIRPSPGSRPEERASGPQ